MELAQEKLTRGWGLILSTYLANMNDDILNAMLQSTAPLSQGAVTVSIALYDFVGTRRRTLVGSRMLEVVPASYPSVFVLSGRRQLVALATLRVCGEERHGGLVFNK